MLNKDLYLAVGETILKEHSIIDRQGNYKFLGNTAQNLTGFTNEAVKTKNIRDYIHEDDIGNVFNQLNNLLPGKTSILVPFRFKGTNNIYRWIESSVTNMVDNEHIGGFLVNSRDVTGMMELSYLKNKITSSYSSFFTKHPFGVAHMTMDGVVDLINPKITEDLGYKLINVAERPLLSFFLPKHRKNIFQMFNAARKHGKSETFDVQAYTSKGESLHVNLTIVPVVHEGETIEIYAVVKNITDRIILKENLERLSIVADKTTNGVIITDGRGVIEWVNNGFSAMNGYTLDEAKGRKIGEILKGNTPPELRERMEEQLRQGIPYTKEVLCEKKDGTKYWNLVDITPVLDKNNKLERRISIHTDISTRIKAEEELKLFAEDLYKRNKELHQFAYVVSHNLRSPVANIMAIADLLELDKEDPETVEQCTKELKTSIHRLDNVIRDLSKILSITDGAIELAREDVDITQMMRDVTADLDEIIQRSGAVVNIPSSDHFLNSHRAYLNSVFYNLISNAIKYRSEKAPEINISIEHVDGDLNIKIADNGIGIDLKKHAEDIFKPYKRFNTLVDGKGLGLFLVKSHVEALNGKISIDSEPGEGSTFTIMLPAK